MLIFGWTVGVLFRFQPPNWKRLVTDIVPAEDHAVSTNQQVGPKRIYPTVAKPFHKSRILCHVYSDREDGISDELNHHSDRRPVYTSHKCIHRRRWKSQYLLQTLRRTSSRNRKQHTHTHTHHKLPQSLRNRSQASSQFQQILKKERFFAKFLSFSWATMVILYCNSRQRVQKLAGRWFHTR